MGERFEVGLPTSAENSGNFTLAMANDGASFIGTWTYGSAASAVAGTWDEQRVSAVRPSDQECFSSPATVAGNTMPDMQLLSTDNVLTKRAV